MSFDSPHPLPENITREKIEAMTVDDGDWRKNENFLCRKCGHEAYLHPYSNWIWGCKRCHFTTYNVVYSFAPAPNIYDRYSDR